MPDSSILADVDDVINEELGLKEERLKYNHKKRLQLFSRGAKPDLNGKALIQKILDKVNSNWREGESRSDENWRWKKNCKIDPNNTSQEVALERWIVRTTGTAWVNQVPVASGLTPSAAGRRAIDLVHRCRNGWYDFIELKIDERRGGTPLFAAMEILQYGVLYIFSRENAQTLGYKKNGNKLLGARGIHLKVMAPAAYYRGYDLSWLENSISGGLANFLDKRDSKFKMDFKFEPFPLTWTSALRRLQTSSVKSPSITQ